MSDAELAELSGGACLPPSARMNSAKGKLVDSRAGALQGAALYICSTKKLAAEDIRLMQHVGRSEKANVLL